MTLVGAPAPLQRLVAELGRLPGIGEKTALRLAFHILRADQGYARGLAQAIVTAQLVSPTSKNIGKPVGDGWAMAGPDA